ncbi:MAG TPA: translocation/assembly module TamB domain-containing protein [Bryobacteraceae bacterium]|nr:translocation/assembly module TamB domain-containing protein [Bryobacteraceae bacterium]
MRRAARNLLRLAVGLSLLAMILFVAGALVVKSHWFYEKVRLRMISEIERATGGDVSLGGFYLNWRTLNAEVRDLVLRGTEPAEAAPLFEAKTIQLGVKIISLLEKDINVRFIAVREPKVNLIIRADGSTNIPKPKIPGPPGEPGLQPLINLKIGQLTLSNLLFQFADQKSLIDIKAENLAVRLAYDFSGPRYQGTVIAQPVDFKAGKTGPIRLALDAAVALERNRIAVSRARLDLKRSRIDASGSIDDLAEPKALFRFSARVSANEAGEILKIPAARQGMIDLAGKFEYKGPTDFNVTAGANLRGLEVQDSNIHISDIRGTTLARLDHRGLELDSMAIQTLGGRFTGRASLPGLKRVAMQGVVQDILTERALEALVPGLTPVERSLWTGSASGPMTLESPLTGTFGFATADVVIAPAPGGIPIEGTASVRYDGAPKTLTFANSHIQAPGMVVDASGTLNEKMQVRITSTDLQKILPSVNALLTTPLKSFPIELKTGSASFEGVVTGNLKSPDAAGAVAVERFVYSGIQFDRFTGQVSANESSVVVKEGTLTRGAEQAQVAASLGMDDWGTRPSSPITATVRVRGAEISEWLDLAGEKQIRIKGGLALSGRVDGTLGDPKAAGDVTLTKGVAWDEPFDRVQAKLEYSSRAVRVPQITMSAGPAQLSGSASFEPSKPFEGAPEFRNGRAQFSVAGNEMALQRFETLKQRQPGLTGFARVDFEGAANLRATQAGKPPEVMLTALKGNVAARDLRLDGRLFGAMKAAAQTDGSVLRVKLDSDFLNSNITASGQWRLEPGYPGEGTARFSRISLGKARAWLGAAGESKAPAFDGSMEGTVTIAGPALDVPAWKASASLSTLEVYPVEQVSEKAPAERFILRNEGPVQFTMARSIITVSRAHFTGPSSDFNVTGTAAIDPKFNLDLRVNGGVNLAILRNLTPDIETAGAVTMNASIRGTPEQPSINGRLDVRRGSVHLADINTGLSNANGSILFSGDQATLQDFTGLVGGGSVSLSGVVGFAGSQLTYRVNVNAKDVRVRYPEGVSTSANAELRLLGTTQRSTLSGLVTVLRTGFAPHTDFSSILGKATEPVRTPSARTGPLSGMQFDVRVETAPDISFVSSLAQDIQVEGNLRLQGTPYNPVLLGRLNVTQGEINFFGTKYTIDQGSVTFANPVKLDPVLNVDLETRVQGIDVTLTISGPINKLNITPRSDPPMSYADVLALLATGSAPSSEPTLAARQNAPQQGFTHLGPSALIGQVVANPVSSRLQRFFGVSSLKINPRITGVENNPQARVTLEQQVTKDVTFTYITNIASTNQVVVRIEWALNKNWSAIALRDENGLFGLDFLYKKRFK